MAYLATVSYIPALSSHVALTWQSLTQIKPQITWPHLTTHDGRLVESLISYLTRCLSHDHRFAQKNHKSASTITDSFRVFVLSRLRRLYFSPILSLSLSLSLSRYVSLSLCVMNAIFKCLVIVLGLNLSYWVLRIWEFWDVMFCNCSGISIYLYFSLVVSHSHTLSSSLPL